MRSVEDRFMKFVEKIPESTCWYWMGHRNSVNGYGFFSVSRARKTTAHRISYELFAGAIPEGMDIDHLCRERSCVNPRHLEAVTHAENVRRSPFSVSTMNSAKVSCPRGHVAYKVYASGGRFCMECSRLRARAKYYGITVDEVSAMPIAYPKKLCKRGHERKPANLTNGGGCLACRRERRANGSR